MIPSETYDIKFIKPFAVVELPSAKNLSLEQYTDFVHFFGANMGPDTMAIATRNIHGICRSCKAYCGKISMPLKTVGYREFYTGEVTASMEEMGVKHVSFFCEACGTQTRTRYQDPIMTM